MGRFFRQVVKKLLLTFLVCPAVVLFGFIWLRMPRAPQDYAQKIFGSQQVLDALVASRQVTAERLHFQIHDGRMGDLSKLAAYEHGPAVAVAAAQFQQIQELLRKPSSYYWEPRAKSCAVDYGMVFTFRGGQRTVRVVLCFNCNWLGIFDGEDESTASINGGADFDPIRGQLVAIVKTIFPDDPEIQGLKAAH